MKRSKLFAVLALVLALCMVLSACGGEADTTEAPADTTAAATEADTEAATEADTEAATEADTEAATEADTEAATEADTEAVDGEVPTEASGSLTIGLLEGITGDFGGTDQFSGGVDDNTMYKIFVRGYQVVETDRTSKYQVNATAVKNLDIAENADGSKTYTVDLNEGLVYNDGTPITAKDYVAGVLYRNSKAFIEFGAYGTLGSKFLGHDVYSSGENEVFEGVRLLGDYQFAITVAAETDGTPNFPDFEEVRYMENVFPLKLDAWVDGEIDVVDEGNGCKFTTPLTIDMISAKAQVERYTPTYSCAPYVFKSWDANGKIGVCEVNPNFAGNWEGQKPLISELMFKDVYGATYTDELKTGSVDLVNTVGKGTDINALMDLADQGLLDYCGAYSNQFQGFRVRCDFGASQFVEVRQAMMYALNRDEISAQMTQGYGCLTNGCYTPALWMYEETEDILEETLNPYNFSLEDAKQVLIDGGWTLNKDGGEYVEGVDDYRYKQLEDGTLMECYVACVGTPTSTLCEISFAMQAENYPQVGIHYEFSKLEWAVCLQYLSRELEDTYHLICCGMGFDAGAFDQTNEYTLDQSKLDMGINSSYCLDEELFNAAQAIVNTPAGDEETYLDNFVKFQQRWNYLIPSIPIYCPPSYDFFIPQLKNYEVDVFTGICQAILYAYIAE